ncbi:E3 ubiquitin-protein ligase MIB2-like [Saccostrea echinata]|uniref:E3 ubiquitin-protein ligase MIB2-like n=1 Tax=Saccostrea echinata TaxID=191078 RepID=UPI002A7EB7E7|nr:E3 ubiquitin-protein ligase MIB2-like [Saccostrea echinata]
MAGLRVVRGPDWDQGDSDGGEGHLGTVVGVIEKEVVVNVVWDIGNITTCRIGKDKKYDLRVFDNASIGIVFKNKKCSECQWELFYGMCWECKICKDTNLCSICYFRGKHDMEHEFVRYTMPNAEGVDVQKRFSSLAMRSFGMYPGAKVIRGKDWEYDDQDGGSGTVGTVRDIRSFKKDMSHRNAVGVMWPSGKGFVYRIGYKGKVDLVCKEVARGFEYYREHLPLLDFNLIKNQVSTQSTAGVKIGDQVCITLSIIELKEAQKNFGFHDEMESAIGKRGIIDGFADNGGIVVRFQDNKWVFNPKALSKVWRVATGETVRVKNDQRKVEALQKGHGEWNPKMSKVLGKVGKIARITPKNDVIVSFGRKHWVFNVACLTPCPGAQVDEIEEDDDLSLSVAAAGLANGLGLLLEQLRILHAQKTRLSPEQFLRMVADGDDKMVLQMVKGEPNLCNMQIKGTTALIAASFEGHDAVVKVLISNGAKVDQTDQNGNTALLASVSADKHTTVMILLEAGCDVNAANKNGRTAIHVAAKAGFEEPAKLLIAYKCSVNVQDVAGDTPLHDAIENGQNALISLIADVKGINFRLVNRKGYNALIFAALKGNKTATNKITAKCPEMTNEPDSNKNNTALHVAAVNNKTEIATILLLQGGADPNKSNKDGRTPLHMACIEAYYNMVKILLDHGVSISVSDNDGNTPLHCALGGVRAQPMLLILMGHQVQTKTERVKIACMLIEFGAKIDQRNKKGQQAIDLATEADVKAAVQQHADAVSKRRRETGGRDRPNSGRKEQLMFQQQMVVPCFMCFRQTGSVTNDPCGHRCLCPNCCFRTEECPVCLQKIDRRLDPHGNVLQPLNLDDLCKVQ